MICPPMPKQMVDHDDQAVFGRKFHHQGVKDSLSTCIKPGCGLVKQQNTRLETQAAIEIASLALAVRTVGWTFNCLYIH